MIHRKFISIILAIAVAITGLAAAPARAGDDDLLKLLAGVAAVAVIGTAIAKKRKKNKDAAVSRNNTYHDTYRHHRDDSYDRDRRRGHRNSHRHHRDHESLARPLPNRVKRKRLPAGCHIQARSNRGYRFGAFGAQCLENNYRFARSLPSQCVRKARVSHSHRKHYVYSDRCLSDYGYFVSRR